MLYPSSYLCLYLSSYLPQWPFNLGNLDSTSSYSCMICICICICVCICQLDSLSIWATRRLMTHTVHVDEVLTDHLFKGCKVVGWRRVARGESGKHCKKIGNWEEISDQKCWNYCQIWSRFFCQLNFIKSENSKASPKETKSKSKPWDLWTIQGSGDAIGCKNVLAKFWKFPNFAQSVASPDVPREALPASRIPGHGAGHQGHRNQVTKPNPHLGISLTGM